MGENPNHIYDVGTPAIDNIMTIERLTRANLKVALDFKFYQKNLLVTFHPTTLAAT